MWLLYFAGIAWVLLSVALIVLPALLIKSYGLIINKIENKINFNVKLFLYSSFFLINYFPFLYLIYFEPKVLKFVFETSNFATWKNFISYCLELVALFVPLAMIQLFQFIIIRGFINFIRNSNTLFFKWTNSIIKYYKKIMFFISGFKVIFVYIFTYKYRKLTFRQIINYIKMIPHNHVAWVPFDPKPMPHKWENDSTAKVKLIDLPYFTLEEDARDYWYARQRIEHYEKLTLKHPKRAKIDRTIWFFVYWSFMLGIWFLFMFLFELLLD